jgi:hypothetical protein
MVEETFEPGMAVSFGSPTWRCPEPALNVASGSGGSADGRRQRRTGRAGVGLPESGARAPTAARQKRLEAEILKEVLEHATGCKNSCSCRRRRQRTVRDEDRGGGDWGLPLQSDRTHARAQAAKRRPVSRSCTRKWRILSSPHGTLTGPCGAKVRYHHTVTR